MFRLFRNKRKELPKRSIEDLKNHTRILFIDDCSFNTVKAIKEKDGWKNVSSVKDIDSMSQTELVDAHIVFVDIQGVGKKLNFKDEGFGLIKAIRDKYPEKKIIMYSAESSGSIDGFHPSVNLVDYRLRKTASRYEFSSLIERFAQDAFCPENCINSIKLVLSRDFGIVKTDDEIRNILEKIYAGNNYETSNISKAFSLSNIGSVASIIQLFFML